MSTLMRGGVFMDKLRNKIEAILAKIKDKKSVENCLGLLTGHSQIQDATFQFINSKPNQFSIPYVKTSYPAE